jgi:hypothetical protein
VRIANVFPANAGDSLTLIGSYTGGRYRLRAESRGEAIDRVLHASPSLMWAFLLPLPTYAFGADVHLLTGFWLTVAWTLMGYWAGRAVPIGPGHGLLGAMAGILVGGLAVAPLVFGLPTAHWSEWLAGIAGASVGWIGAQRSLARDRLRIREDITRATHALGAS